MTAIPASAETLTLAWDANTEPQVAGYIVYIGPSAGVYDQRVDVGQVTQYALAASPGTAYCFAVSAYAPGPAEGPRSADVCATAANAAPTLVNPGAQSSLVGQPVSLSLSAVDPEGAPLTYTVSGLPPGLTASATGIITGTPTQTGTSAVSASVSDGELSATVSFGWTVTGSAPGAATLLRPTGAITTTAPVFEWTPVGTATRYRLWVDDAGPNQQLQRDLTPSEAGCAVAGTVCRSSLGLTLMAGPASWSVRATNAYGDGPWAGAMDFTMPGSQGPTVTITTPTSATTYSTGAATIAISGTSTDDVGVTAVSWATDKGASGSAVGTAAWSVASIPLQAGANVITVTARDGQNNTATDVLTVTFADTQAPTVDIAQPTATGTYSTTSPTLGLGGVASDNVGVTEVRWSNSQGGSGVASGTGTWSAGALTLKAGTNVISVTARDAAGNTASDTLTVTVIDNVAPTVTIARPGSLSTPAATAVLTGTAADAFGVVQVAWSNNRGGSGVASGTTSWTVAGIPIEIGANIITITARDAAGLIGTDAVTVTRTDGDAPTVSLVTPTTGGTYATTARTLALAGASADAVGVTQVTWANSRGGGGTAAGTTSWAVQGVALQLGTNVITVTARDAAGNAGQAVLSVTATDGEPPTVAILTPVAAAAYSTSVPTVTLTGTAADAVGVTAVTWSNSQGGGGTAGGTTSWSVPGVTLVPGVNVITVLARDAAGNTGRTQLSITATDTRAPVVTILSNGPSTTAGAIQLSGTASDDFGLASLSWRNGRGGSGMATGTTSWIAAVVPVQPGSNDITVTATDKAGNSATSVLKINSNKVKDPAPATSTMTSDLTTSTSALTPIAGAPVYPSTPASRIMPAQSLRPALSIEPTVINGPWVTSSSTVPLKGTATDNVTRVTWSVDWGGSGTASGTREWTVPTVGLQIGRNVITVTAMTADGRVDRQSVTVTYQPLRASR